MKAIIVKEDQPGRPLVWEDTPTPDLKLGEVLVKVHACALNRADLHQRAGNYPPPPGSSPILGLEMAGTIAQLGDGVSDWKVGARVCALLPGGGYAEYATVPAPMLIPIPQGMSFEQAAGIPEVFFTAYTNLFDEAALQPGEVVLVHAGASGVGTAAIQLAKLHGCTVYATVGTKKKTALCEALGADLAINYREHDFSEVLRKQSGFRGVDVVFDMVGRDYLERNLELLQSQGRIVFVSLLSGSDVKLNLRTLMVKRLRLIGTTLRSRTLQEKIDIRNAFLSGFNEALESGAIKPVIDRVFPIQHAEKAQRYMQDNQNIGKIVLKIS